MGLTEFASARRASVSRATPVGDPTSPASWRILGRLAHQRVLQLITLFFYKNASIFDTHMTSKSQFATLDLHYQHFCCGCLKFLISAQTGTEAVTLTDTLGGSSTNYLSFGFVKGAHAFSPDVK